MSQTLCFYCGLPVPDHFNVFVTIDGKVQPMCCHGCQPVVDAKLEDFYKHRTNNVPTGQEVVPEFLQQTKVCGLIKLELIRSFLTFCVY